MLGDAGLTPAVLKEIDATLKSHELIKIKVLGADRQNRKALLDEICRTLDAGAVQQIGKMLVVYRPRPEEDRAAPPSARSARKTRRRTKRSYQMR